MPENSKRSSASARHLAWIEQIGLHVERWQALAGDASARAYFRLWAEDRSWILMVAPPPENVSAFLKVAELFRGVGIRVPTIYAADLDQGRLLLEDFGDLTFFCALQDGLREELYQEALTTLVRLQTRIDPDLCDLPRYDETLLRRELEIFRTWLIEGWLEMEVPLELWRDATEVLVRSALEQPKVVVHRDYHSRNLMVLPEETPGVLDFQDAVVGPVTYDLVSLLRDCYLAWPEEWVSNLSEAYRLRLEALGMPISSATWRRWFDRMGAQRHLKAAGIFARLWLRDGKPGYLRDIPRTLGYVLKIAQGDAELAQLGEFLTLEVLPEVVRRVA
jgi:aminoglycoside/choline kinase family phosphotransferase